MYSEALKYALTHKIENCYIDEVLLTTICHKSASKPLSQEASFIFRQEPIGIPIEMPKEKMESSFYSEIDQILKNNSARIIKHSSNQGVLIYLKDFANRMDFTRPNTGSFAEAIINAFSGVVWKAGDGKSANYIAHSIVPCFPNQIRNQLKAIFNNYNNQITTKITEQEKLDLVLRTIQGIMLVFPCHNCSSQPYFVLMQRLLLQNGLSPVVIVNCRQFYFYPLSYLHQIYNQGRMVLEKMRPGKENTIILKSNNQCFWTDAIINNYQVNGLIDTGATTVAIPKKIANKIGLQQGHKYYVSTSKGSAKVYKTMIDELKIGAITLKDVEGNINPSMKDGYILIGMSVLNYLTCTMSNGILTLSDQGIISNGNHLTQSSCY